MRSRPKESRDVNRAMLVWEDEFNDRTGLLAKRD
jgi:hypothetical protein